MNPAPSSQEESDIITEAGSQKYYADFHALLTKPSCREVAVAGLQNIKHRVLREDIALKPFKQVLYVLTGTGQNKIYIYIYVHTQIQNVFQGVYKPFSSVPPVVVLSPKVQGPRRDNKAESGRFNCQGSRWFLWQKKCRKSPCRRSCYLTTWGPICQIVYDFHDK